MATFGILHPSYIKNQHPHCLSSSSTPLFSSSLLSNTQRSSRALQMSDYEDYCYGDDYYSDNEEVDSLEYFKEDQGNSSPGREWFRRGELPSVPRPTTKIGESSIAKLWVERGAAENPPPAAIKAEPDVEERVGKEVQEECQALTIPEKMEEDEVKEDDTLLSLQGKSHKPASA